MNYNVFTIPIYEYYTKRQSNANEKEYIFGSNDFLDLHEFFTVVINPTVHGAAFLIIFKNQEDH